MLCLLAVQGSLGNIGAIPGGEAQRQLRLLAGFTASKGTVLGFNFIPALELLGVFLGDRSGRVGIGSSGATGFRGFVALSGDGASPARVV